MDKQEWFTPKEAAEYLRISVPQIYRLTQKGELQAYHVGRSRRYRRHELDALMQPAADGVRDDDPTPK